MRTYLAILLWFLVHACGMTSETHPDPLSILGSDNRVTINAKAWPWSAVGRLNATFDDQTQSFCTATLVGKNSLVTAAHCIKKNGSPALTLTFFTEYSYGSFGAKAHVIRELVGTEEPQNRWSRDWALLEIDRDLGLVYGTLPFLNRERASASYPLLVDLPGFAIRPNQVESMIAHLGCHLGQNFVSHGRSRVPFPEMEGTIGHNCDLQAGTSGAPLITWIDQQPYIAAIQSYHWQTSDGQKGNGAVPLNEVHEALKHFESESANARTGGV